MFLTLRSSFASGAPVLALAVLTSCSSAPSGPEKGTPAFFWQAARETYAAGDYMKTMEHLDRLMEGDNEYAGRALPWLLVLSSGTAAGYIELADNYQTGVRANKSDPSAFRRPMGQYRAAANRLAIQFAENAGKLDRIKGDTISLAFPYPKGTAAPVALLGKVSSGIILTPADAETAQKRALERGVLLAACRAAGAPDDTAKTEEFLRNPDAKVPRAVFLTVVANTLYDESQIYAADKLGDSEKQSIFCQRAQNALKSVPESKDTKALSAKLDKVLKKKS